MLQREQAPDVNSLRMLWKNAADECRIHLNELQKLELKKESQFEIMVILSQFSDVYFH